MFSDHVSADGTYVFKVYACNGAGCSATPSQITVIKDTVSPPLYSFHINGGAGTTTSTTVTLTGAG